jgi:hypothetical protein
MILVPVAVVRNSKSVADKPLDISSDSHKKGSITLQ